MNRREWAEEALRRIKDLPPAQEIGQERFREEWLVCLGHLVEEAQAFALSGHDDVPKDGHHVIHVWRALTAQEIQALQEVPGYAQGIANMLLPVMQAALYDVARHYQETAHERPTSEEPPAPSPPRGDAEREGSPPDPAPAPAPEAVPPAEAPRVSVNGQSLMDAVRAYGMGELQKDMGLSPSTLYMMARGEHAKPPRQLPDLALCFAKKFEDFRLETFGWTRETIQQDVAQAWQAAFKETHDG